MQTSKISIAFRIGAGKLLSGEYQSVSTCVSDFLRDLPKLILAFLWFPFSFKTDQHQQTDPRGPRKLMAPSFSGPRSIWGISAKEKLTFLWPFILPQVSSGCISLDHMGSFVKWGCSYFRFQRVRNGNPTTKATKHLSKHPKLKRIRWLNRGAMGVYPIK